MGAVLVAFYATAKGDDLLRSCDWHDEGLYSNADRRVFQLL